MNQTLSLRVTSNAKKKSKAMRTLFYVCMVAIPVVQFVIFYIVVNFNSILLAFKSYDNSTGVVIENWIGWGNFERIFQIFRSENILWIATKNSLLYLVFNLCVVIPLSMLFAYYIYRGYPAAGFFKVMLFLPAVICSMVLVIFFKEFVETAIPELAERWFHGDGWYAILSSESKGPVALMIFYVWFLFSGSILLYLNAMSNIPKSQIEAAQIDGAGEFRTFWRIVIPAIWPTLVSLIILAMADFVANQANLFSIYGIFAPSWSQTLGYYQFFLVARYGADSPVNYPIASAFGLLFTAIVAPITLLTRHLLLRFGPRED